MKSFNDVSCNPQSKTQRQSSTKAGDGKLKITKKKNKKQREIQKLNDVTPENKGTNQEHRERLENRHRRHVNEKVRTRRDKPTESEGTPQA